MAWRWSGTCVLLALALTARGQVVLQLRPGSTAGTVVGNGTSGSVAPGQAALSPLGAPRGVTQDAAGNLYIADARNHVVLKVTAAGQLGVVAGTGRQGYAGDGGAATAADLNAPTAVAVDATGNLYIADTGNHCVREVKATGLIATVAGNGSPGATGDGGAATTARLRSPRGLALDSAGDLYIADTGNHRVRELRTDGTIAAFAGTGTEGNDGDNNPAANATLQEPTGLAVTPAGSVLIADTAARRVRVVSSGIISGYAVNVRRPEGLAADAFGTLLAADAGNQVLIAASSDGATPVAGTGTQGAFAAGSPLATPLDTPAAVTAGGDGTLLLADRRNHQVQRIALGRLDFGTVAAGGTSAAQTITLQNAGTAALQVLGVALPSRFAMAAAGTTCGTTPLTLQPAATCVLALAFSPSTAGSVSGLAQVRVADAAPQSVLLVGTGTSASGTLAASVTSLTSSGGISYAGAPVAFTATVTGGMAVAPTGTVQLMDGSTPMMSGALNNGSATLTTSSLALGQHALSATYSGNAVYAASSSPALSTTVVPAPDFTFASSSASYTGTAGTTMTLPLVLTPVNGTLNHIVTLSTTGLPSGATVSVLPNVITLGSNPITATLTVTMPATLSQVRVLSLLAAAMLLPFSLVRRRRVLCLGILLGTLAMGGCGGFRGTANSVSIGGSGGLGGGSGTTHSYNAVVTAATTGVLGDTLTHTVSIALVVTQ